MKNYYQTLGLNESASEDEIKRAYKRMAMQHHPDRGGDVSQFQEIQEAYETLTNPQRRSQWEQQRQWANGARGQNFGFSFNFGPDLNDILRQFHGGDPFGQFRQQHRNRDLRIHIDIDLASTLNQQQKTVEIRHQDGSSRTVQIDIPRGVQNGVQMRLTGHGDHSNKASPPGDLYVDFRLTDTAGFTVNHINISKKLELNSIDAIIGTRIAVQGLDKKHFDLSIPPGTQNGTQFRIPGQGLYDINTQVRGDLFFEVALITPILVSQSQLDMLKQYT
jgi:DnaJ-class molecular chaperone